MSPPAGGRRAALAALLLAVALGGCAQLARAPAPAPAPRPALALTLEAPAEIEALLRQHLEVQRYRDVEGLTAAEWQRLASAVPEDARRLLATAGHFSPEVAVTFDAQAQPPRLAVRVEPGPRTHVASVQLRLHGPAGADPERHRALQAVWPLPPGHAFTQGAWDDAKRAVLAALRRHGYPHAAITHSLADIDPVSATAHLHVELDSGPLVRLGPVIVEGAQRYPATQAERLARLAGLRVGVVHDEQVLQDVQRHLAATPHYDAAFARLEEDGPPEAHPVRLQVREAPRQQLSAALGATTDRGARLTLQHTHLRVPALDAMARTTLLWSGGQRALGSDWTGLLDAGGWHWRGGAELGWRSDGPVRTLTRQLRLQREQPGLRLQRGLFVQWDGSREQESGGPATRARSLSAGLAWTRRDFHPLDDPEAGHGLAAEVSLGTTLGAERHPYLRARLRTAQVWALPPRQGRLVGAAEAGAVWASAGTTVPAGQRFLAGGEGSVRGYAPASLGVVQTGGGVQPGRMLLRASLEWQRPLDGGAPGPWELALFADTAAVADRWAALRPAWGVGAGVRHRSPVGPLRADLAYGVQERRWRLHVSVGFAF